MSAANSCRSALLGLLAALPLVAPAQGISTRLPISLDADSSELDRRNNVLVFRGLRITQGTIGIEADRGETLIGGDGSLEFRDSVWRFDGRVQIDVDTTSIRCDQAELTFKDHQLSRAVVSGDPARFSDRRSEDGAITTGQAGRFEYDLPAGTVKFSDDARISEGENTITGDLLLYDLNRQIVTARGGDETGKVSLTIVPEEGAAPDREETP